VIKAKFHYASWFEAGRRPASNWNLAYWSRHQMTR